VLGNLGWWDDPSENCFMATAAVHRLTTRQVSHAVITAAMRVHSELGPGLLESTYVASLQYELTDAGIRSSAPVGLPAVTVALSWIWATAWTL
jgi:hypothetical protein